MAEITAQLIALSDDVTPSEFTLRSTQHTLGRSEVCEIVIARSIVSRLHARFERRGPRFALIDVGSANGTFVNGHLISGEYLLNDRDSLGFGSAEGVLRFADPDPTAPSGVRLSYDLATRSFTLGQQMLELTPNQLRLLELLYAQHGHICSREACAQAVWGRDYDPGLDADALDRLVSNLRGVLRRFAPERDLLQTKRGLGYLLQL